MVKSIFLQDGEEIFVDDEDYERVNQHNWHKSFNGNHRMVMNNDSKHLPNFILEKSFQMIKNNDFTRKNLTTEGNAVRWQGARFNNSSKYKGVSWDKKSNKWYVKIRVGEKVKSLGFYSDEDKAAMVYNSAVNEYWDGHGYLNIIGEDNRIKERNYKTHKNQLNKRTNKKKMRGIRIVKNKYYVRIYYSKREYSLGVYDDLDKARSVYNKVAIYLHNNDAILNDVPMTDELKEFISNWEIPDKIKALKEGAENE